MLTIDPKSPSAPQPTTDAGESTLKLNQVTLHQYENLGVIQSLHDRVQLFIMKSYEAEGTIHRDTLETCTGIKYLSEIV